MRTARSTRSGPPARRSQSRSPTRKWRARRKSSKKPMRWMSSRAPTTGMASATPSEMRAMIAASWISEASSARAAMVTRNCVAMPSVVSTTILATLVAVPRPRWTMSRAEATSPPMRATGKRPFTASRTQAIHRKKPRAGRRRPARPGSRSSHGGRRGRWRARVRRGPAGRRGGSRGAPRPERAEGGEANIEGGEGGAHARARQRGEFLLIAVGLDRARPAAAGCGMRVDLADTARQQGQQCQQPLLGEAARPGEAEELVRGDEPGLRDALPQARAPGAQGTGGQTRRAPFAGAGERCRGLVGQAQRLQAITAADRDHEARHRRVEMHVLVRIGMVEDEAGGGE